MTILREIAAPFVADPVTGVCIRTRLKGLTDTDEAVLAQVGAYLGRLAGADLAARVRAGRSHDKDAWADRKRGLTVESTARWAGSITKATHDQWGLARRAQAAHAQSLRDGIAMIGHRLAQELGAKGTGGMPGGYRTRQEWFAKTRRLAVLQQRLAAVQADRAAGHVSVVRGGKQLLHKRHHLAEAGLTQLQWRDQWEAARWFLSADGESGKRWGNETIRVTGDGELSLRLPAPLAQLANAAHGRYVLSGTVQFAHRGAEWADRVSVNRAIAYRIHFSPDKARWYLDATWQRTQVPTMPLESLRAGELVGVDMNADHLAAWHLDPHGNPVGAPRTFGYDLSGSAEGRDAQVRHAVTRLLHWATNNGSKAIAVEDLDFTDSKTREKHGRRRRFRHVISGMPTAKLRARLLSMATGHGISVIAVDPAYTSKWGAQHWHEPLAAHHPQTTRHHAASVAIGRRALGHRIRRRVAPPQPHQSDVAQHRTTQAQSGVQQRETPRHPRPGPRTRSACPPGAKNAGRQATQHRSGPPTEQNPVSLSVEERFLQANRAALRLACLAMSAFVPDVPETVPTRAPAVDPVLTLTGERTIPGLDEENYWFRRHEVVYQRLARRCAGREVLEAGCGEGYGADLIAGVARRVIALDYDESAVAHVRAHYPRVAAIHGNLTELPLADGSVDAVVNFQVIEHLWDQDRFVSECTRVLRSSGLLMMSTPNRITFSPGRDTPINPFHTRELNADELTKLLDDAGFASVSLSGVFHGPRLREIDARHGGSIIDAQIARAVANAPWPPELLADVAAVTTADFEIVEAAEPQDERRDIRDINTSLDLVAIAVRP